jgi:hypothetical protein
MKQPLPPIDIPGVNAIPKFDSLLRSIMQVPKAEIDRREKE